jgi:hypothetical protein
MPHGSPQSCVRALHKEFGIPLEVLVQETGRAA